MNWFLIYILNKCVVAINKLSSNSEVNGNQSFLKDYVKYYRGCHYETVYKCFGCSRENECQNSDKKG